SARNDTRREKRAPGIRLERGPADPIVAEDPYARGGLLEVGDDHVGLIGEVRLLLQRAERALGTVDVAIGAPVHAHSAIHASGLRWDRDPDGHTRLPEMDPGLGEGLTIPLELPQQQ